MNVISGSSTRAPIPGRSTHSARLERWLGEEQVEAVSRAMRDFYFPVAVHGVPGSVYAMPGGGFAGEIRAGSEMSAVDRAVDALRRARRNRFARAAMSRRQLGAFGSLAALVTAATTAGKRTDSYFNKVGVASNAAGNCVDLWAVGNLPAAGAAGGAAPGGTVPDKSTTGAMAFSNASVNANTTHFTTGYATANFVNTLLLYDRLFMVAKTMNSIAIEQVSGVPTRYQNTSATASDYIGGSFCFPSDPTTVLAGTAHNWVAGVTSSPNQGCCYMDQSNVEAGFGLMTGVSACVAKGVDLSTQNWFMTLAAGDTGVKKLNTMQCSALVATGTIDFVLGHPIAFLPCPIANMVCVADGLYTAFNLQFIFDNACLALLEMPKPATNATTYSGQVTMVSE